MGLVNTTGYFDGLVRFLDTVQTEGFLKPKHREMLIVRPTPAAVMDEFTRYAPRAVGKWIGPEEV